MDINMKQCASFSIRAEDSFIFGRNVDAEDASPGFILINKRGVLKENTTFDRLFNGKNDNSKKLSWKSKYGSITFNYSGAEFPDGGMNEAGLIFEEMTLLHTEYPVDESKPTLFMMQWIQYILDTCEKVSQVIESAQNINLDGWNWQFYATDKHGESAVIEFLNGKPVIYTGKNLPYPILTNSIYAEELDKIKEYEGFGGEKPLDVKDYDGPTRFTRGACMIKNYSPAKDISPVDYGFRILDIISPDHMNAPQITTLAKIYDVNNRRVYFRTSIAEKIRYVDMDAFDYSCKTPGKILDIHLDLTGNVTGKFENYTIEANLELLNAYFDQFSQNPELRKYMEENNITIESIIKRHADYVKTVYGF